MQTKHTESYACIVRGTHQDREERHADKTYRVISMHSERHTPDREEMQTKHTEPYTCIVRGTHQTEKRSRKREKEIERGGGGGGGGGQNLVTIT